MTRLRFLDHSEANLRPERNGGNGFIPSGIEHVQKHAKSYILARREFPEAARDDAAMRPRTPPLRIYETQPKLL